MSATLIYDGKCSLCKACVDWIQEREIAGAFTFMACQSEERKSRYPEIPESQCMKAMQLVTEDGVTLSGHEALPEILVRLKGWTWLAVVLRLAPFRFLSAPVYALIARNRHAFAVFVARKECDESCDIGAPHD